MNLGTLNAGVLTSAGLGEIDRSIYALSIPMAFNDYDEVYAVLEKMRPKLEAKFEAKGFVILNWADGGWNHFFTKTPAASPDEMRKLKMFSWAGDASTTEVWKKLGFDPRPAPSTELVTGLQTGLFECYLAPPQVSLITRYYEQTKYMTDMPWQILMGATIIRKETWEKIPADLRPQLLAAARNAGAKLQAAIRQEQQPDIEAMKKNGLIVVPVDAKTREAWRRAAEAAYPLMTKSAMPADAFDDAMRYRDEYRKQKSAAKK
jgi:TRAP-type C4-dicarboxylate transport system substrate-binding protein